MSRRQEMCRWIVAGMLKKKSCDFSRLKVVPESSLKSESMVRSLANSMVVGVFRSKVSSTNWL
jgi:hypothetical protein